MLKKILMVNEFCSYGDGANLYMIKLSEALVSMGITVEIIYGTKRDKEYSNPSIKTHFFPELFGFNYVNRFDQLQNLKKAAQDFQLDIIYIHQVLNPTVIYLLSKIAPTIRYEHGFRLSCPSGRRMPKLVDTICEFPFSWKCMVRAHTRQCMPRNPFVAKKVMKDVYQNIDAHKKMKKIIVASAYIKNLLIMSGFDPDFISIISYFVDIPDTFIPHDPEEELSVLFVGRVEYEKGPDFFLQALAEIERPVTATIIGEGTYIEKLKTRASSIKQHEICFPGWVDNESLKSYYQQADLLAVTSIWPEPFGIIGIEAMSFGIPTVAFDVGGISEWLKDGENGFLVERKDVSQLAHKMRILLEDQELARHMGVKGMQMVKQRFTLEVHLRQFLKVCEEAMASKGEGNI